MDNKVTKQRINDHFEYDWFKYLILAAVVLFVLLFSFSQINATRDHEGINVFVSCYSHTENVEEFAEATRVKLIPEGGGNALRELNFEHVSPKNVNDYTTLLPTHGYISSDVLILGKTYYEEAATSYIPWSDEFISYAVPEDKRDALEYYEEGGVKYAVKISALKGIADLFEFNTEVPDEIPEGHAGEYDTEFYLAINGKSVNIGKFGKKSKPENMQVLGFLKELFAAYA